MDKTAIIERKQKIIEGVKQKLQAYVDNGGVLENLTAKNEEYIAVKNCDIFVDGKRLTIEERFAYFGYPRKPQQKPYTEKLKDIKAMLDDFVANGGNVDEIGFHHEIYKQMRDFTPVINGRKPSIEEKFEMAGHPRHSRYNDMNTFIERLSELEKFKDENGYVDAYRKDDQLKLFVSYCSLQFGFPISLVVCMLADQKLKKHLVQTNRFEFLKTRLTNYLEQHKTFRGIRRLDPLTYHFLTSVAKSYPSETGRRYSNLEIVEMLGFEGVDNAFSKETDHMPFSETEFMRKYQPVIEHNNGTISLSDMQPFDYDQLTCYLRRKDETKHEFFSRFGVKYSHPRVIERNKRVLLPEYPYLDEMQEKLNQMMLDIASKHPELKNASQAELFSIKAGLIKTIYDEYKCRIEEKYILGANEPTSQEVSEPYSE